MIRYDFPERDLNPPEDNRKPVYKCSICGEGIFAGDDYYDIHNVGLCCEGCISDAKRYDAEPDWPEEED